MKRNHPIRPHAALRGGLRIGTWVVSLPAGHPSIAPTTGSRMGGLPVPI